MTNDFPRGAGAKPNKRPASPGIQLIINYNHIAHILKTRRMLAKEGMMIPDRRMG